MFPCDGARISCTVMALGPSGGNGRRAELSIQFLARIMGSNPMTGTNDRGESSLLSPL